MLNEPGGTGGGKHTWGRCTGPRGEAGAPGASRGHDASCKAGQVVTPAGPRSHVVALVSAPLTRGRAAN